MTNNLIKHQLLFKTQLNDKTVLFQTIQLSISIFFLHTVKWKAFLFQIIQFSISTQFKCQKVHFDRSAATPPGQSEPGSDCNEWVLSIPQSSSITGTSPWECFVSYQDTCWESFTLCIDTVRIFHSPSRLGQDVLGTLLWVTWLESERWINLKEMNSFIKNKKRKLMAILLFCSVCGMKLLFLLLMIVTIRTLKQNRNTIFPKFNEVVVTRSRLLSYLIDLKLYNEIQQK